MKDQCEDISMVPAKGQVCIMGESSESRGIGLRGGVPGGMGIAEYVCAPL